MIRAHTGRYGEKMTTKKPGKDSTTRVKFTLPPGIKAQAVQVCGDFNDWSTDQHPLKKLKNGDFTVTLTLESGRAYRYRYLLDGTRWENDWEADDYVPNEFGGDDSVVHA